MNLYILAMVLIFLRFTIVYHSPIFFLKVLYGI